MNEAGLALYAGRDEFSLCEAGDLWADLLPSMRRRERAACPEQAAAAREWLRKLLVAAMANQLQVSPRRVAAIRPATANARPESGSLRDLLQYRARQLRPATVVPDGPAMTIDEHARVTRAALVVFAKALPGEGGRPAFLFADRQGDKQEDPRARNRRIAAAILDGTMTREQALAEGIKPDNLKRILGDERRRRAKDNGNTDTPSHPVEAWGQKNTIQQPASIAKPYLVKKTGRPQG
jgi:hypothetical protein